MKERSKERYSELLMEELLDHLSRHGKIKKMLGDMISMPVLELISMLVKDFEKIIEQRSRQAADNLVQSVKKTRDLAQEPAHPYGREEVRADTRQSPGVDSAGPSPAMGLSSRHTISEEPPFATDKVSRSGSPMREQTVSAQPEQHEKEEEPTIESSGEVDALLKKIHSPMDNGDLASPQERSKDVAADHSDLEVDDRQEHAIEDDSHPQKHRSLRIPHNFADDDIIYVHAVTRVAEEEPFEPGPFMLEEKGVDQRTFAFAFDFQGLRFYLSKIIPTQMNVSKTGVLLLGKQEGLQLRGVHENILNDLRIHGVLLPFVFGTVARSKADLLEKIDSHIGNLKDAVDDLLSTTWWTLNLYVLDARIAQLFGESKVFSGRPRERERESYSTPTPTRKLDIQVFERMLQKEKKIAEVVHKTLSAIADRSDVDMMVGLESGASEDWKLILKASYEVPNRNLHAFNRAVTELQYDHVLFDLMLSIEGNREPYSF